MQDDPVYLHGSVKIEPLINSWYAWSFLVSPPTFAMITKNLHLRVLESYLRAPKQHAKALQNKALKGGLFLDHQGTLDEIQALLNFTKENLNDLIELSDDINRFSNWLSEHARGGALTDAYRDLPDALRGRVELGYDLYNRGSIRFIEPLFYNSTFYKPALQSISLSLLTSDKRPFVLSSPRLETRDNIILAKPFADTALDDLFAMRHTPQSLDAARTLFDWNALNENKRDLLMQMFTTEAPARCYTPINGNVRFKYFGHATVLMESSRTSVLTDPIISYDQVVGESRFSYKDLPDTIDYVVLTHNHQDHVMLETLLQLRHRIGSIIVPKSSGGTLQDMSLYYMLKNLGFKQVVELGEMQTFEMADGAITGLPFLGEHGDLHVLSKLAFHIKLNAKSALFAADSNNIDPALYKNVYRSIGDIDYIFIGMECAGAPQSWLYGSLYPAPLERKYDEARRLNGSNCERALRLIKQFSPKAVYIYAMGAEPWLTFISSIEYTQASEPIMESDDLIAKCAEINIPAERLYGFKELTA